MTENSPQEAGQKRGLSTATLDLPGWTHVYSGKVRDLYEPTDESIREQVGQDCVLVVASDRISAYDHVLTSEIPDKGRILTQLSLWWFDQLGDVANHLLDPADVDESTAGPSRIPPVPAEVADRSMLVKPLDMFPIECVVRGDLVECLALCGEDRAVGLEQVTALHALGPRACADEEGEVRALEDLRRVRTDLDTGERRERAVVELHDHALESLQRRLDLQQPQLHRGVGAEQGTAGDAEEQAVADLAGGTGHGHLDGLGHGGTP